MGLAIASHDLKSQLQDKSIQDNHLSTNVGTPLYMAPEIKNNNQYDQKIDIYSLGIIYFELL